MTDAHIPSSPESVAPIAHLEAERRAACAQANMLEGAKLKYTSDEQQRPAEHGRLTHDHRRQIANRLQQPLRGNCRPTKRSPQSEIGSDKKKRFRPFAPPPVQDGNPENQGSC